MRGLMRNYFILISFFFFSTLFAAGHITKAQKEKTIECLGHYSATAVLPADTIEVKNMELALASVKVIRAVSYTHLTLPTIWSV